MENKSGMSLTIKPLFAVFIVIFVFFILITGLGSRLTEKETEMHFDSYKDLNVFLSGFLSDPICISVGSRDIATRQSPIHSLIDYNKTMLYKDKDREPGCIQNYDFMYSITIKDLSTSAEFKIGLDKDDPEFAERTVSSSLPCALRYEKGIVHPCQAMMTAYFGEVPTFYGAIKEACSTGKDKIVEFDTDKSITYDGIQFCHGSTCIFPYFPCRVSSFDISEGQSAVLLSYNEGNIEVMA